MSDQNSITAHNLLEPWLVRTIREAFDDAIRMVQERRGPDAPPPSDGMRAKLAKQIVGLARTGECDADRLREKALSALQLSS